MDAAEKVIKSNAEIRQVLIDNDQTGSSGEVYWTISLSEHIQFVYTADNRILKSVLFIPKSSINFMATLNNCIFVRCCCCR